MSAQLLPQHRDTLIVALSSHDMIAALNAAMRVRKITLTLDYTHKDHLLRLYVEMPGSPRETWMITNTRTKRCVHCEVVNPHLQLFINDATERLAALSGALFLVGGRHQRSAPMAKLQLIVEGSDKVAVTVAEVSRGKSATCHYFITPNGVIP